MRPYPGNLDESQHVYIYRRCLARGVIENTFGILLARWSIFRGFIRADVKNVESYVLHNYLRQTDNAGYCPAGFADCEDSSGRIKPGKLRSIVSSGDALIPMQKPHNTRIPNSAIKIRGALKDYLNSQGTVSWQLKHVRRTDTLYIFLILLLLIALQ